VVRSVRLGHPVGQRVGKPLELDRDAGDVHPGGTGSGRTPPGVERLDGGRGDGIGSGHVDLRKADILSL